MKKSTLLVLMVLFSIGMLKSQTLEVTTSEMNASIEGSLLNVLANATSEAVVEFNFEGEILDYGVGTGLLVDAKKITLNGINKRNGKKVTIKGVNTLFSLSGSAELIMNDLILTGFTGVAIKVSGGSTITAERCVFKDNIDPKNTSGNNGGVMRISASNAVLKHSLFINNKGAGSYGGGAICAYDKSNLSVESCSFVQNVGYSGGAIGINARKDKGLPQVYIANSTFANNIVDDRGGAIYMQTDVQAGEVAFFSPAIVNCTFVGNLGKDGGALCVWSRATTKMTPIFVNNLFVENYRDAWMENESRNDVWAFYMGGSVDVNGNPLPQTIFPTCKNNLYVSSSEGFFSDESNKVVNLSNDVVFKAMEKNPLDEGENYYNHQTSVLERDQKVPMIAENSVARDAGISSFEGVVVPTTDQLGNPRGATPSVGSVEYAVLSGLEEDLNLADAGILIWNIGRQLHVKGVEGAAKVYVFDFLGRLVIKAHLDDDSSCRLDGLDRGVFIVKVEDGMRVATNKIIVK